MGHYIVTFPSDRQIWLSSGIGGTGKFRWTHTATRSLKLLSTTPDIFGKRVYLYPRVDTNKPAGGAPIPYGITLQVASIDPDRSYTEAELSIDRQIGDAVAIVDPSYFVAVLPVDNPKIRESIAIVLRREN